jgi:molybdenum cofactor cytidylyltransferase
LEAYQDHNQPLTIPVYRGRKGHPVIYHRQAMEAALALQSHQTGKDLQRIFSAETTFVEVDDPGIVIDIDTPEDYEKYVTPSDRVRPPES